MAPLALYVHIPFCQAKCRYCDFASRPAAEGEIRDYMAALAHELSAVLDACEAGSIETLYIGGGTPTAVPTDLLCELVDRIAGSGVLSADSEVTCEANPGIVGREALEALRQVGVNRLSLGVQSLDDELLGGLGRAHSASDALAAIAHAREAGFDNLSADVLFAIPGQTLAQLESTLSRLIDEGLPHVSAYCLTFEPDTPLTDDRDAGRLAEAPEDTQVEMFWRVEALLEAAWLPRYEISNFARPGFECRHNLVYWRGGEYIGVGAAAHSFIEGERRWSTADIGEYIQRVGAGEAPVEGAEIPDEDQLRAERALMGLRITEGVPLRDLGLADAGTSPDALRSKIQHLVQSGLLELFDGRARLTRQGLIVADSVVLELVSSWA